MSEKPRMLWVARDADGSAWCFRERPTNNAGAWTTESSLYSALHTDAVPDLLPGEFRMFVEFAPRVAEEGTWGQDEKPAQLAWDRRVWKLSFGQNAGDIILPMPPDPTPYLTQADPNAARREEIRAQIAALQAELEGMEG